MYEAVLIKGRMIGGHYAIARAGGSTILEELGLDQKKALLLAVELNRAYMAGRNDQRGTNGR